MIAVLSFVRSLISVLVLFPIWTVTLSLFCILYNLIWSGAEVNNRINNAFLRIWATGVCWMFGVRVRVKGRENIPSGTFLLLFNHESFFDIFAISKELPDVRFGGKIELFRIPVFGWAMKRIGILPIARGDVESVIRVYKAAEERSLRGERFALAPEGARNSGDGKLLPFKSGPFLFALSAKTPILPVVIDGAGSAWPKHTLVPQSRKWSSEIGIHILNVVPVDNLGFQKLGEAKVHLQKKVRGLMEEKIASLEATSSKSSTPSQAQSEWTPEGERL